jgi:hypothetical protein
LGSCEQRGSVEIACRQVARRKQRRAAFVFGIPTRNIGKLVMKYRTRWEVLSSCKWETISRSQVQIVVPSHYCILNFPEQAKFKKKGEGWVCVQTNDDLSIDVEDIVKNPKILSEGPSIKSWFSGKGFSRLKE